MRAFWTLIVLVATTVAVAAQTPKDAFRPSLFEPYSADYRYTGNILGMDFRLFDYSTRIIELDDHWEELQSMRFKLPDEPEITLNSTTTIDLATGYLRKIKVSDGSGDESEMLFEDGRVEITATDGKKTKKATVEIGENVYPCYFSSVFLSYQPLAEGYERSFTCVMPDEEDRGAFLVQRLTMKVVGREKISVKTGLFDCFKITSDVEDLKLIKNGRVKEFSKSKKRSPAIDNFWRNVFSFTWIDVSTRKVIRGEFDFKGLGGITTEIEKDLPVKL